MPTLRAVAFSLALLPVATFTAHAQQLSVYGAVDITQYGFRNGGSSYSYKPGDAGFTLGGFYNFEIDSRVTVGVDIRNTYSPGIKGGDAASANFRVAFVPHKVRLRPFFQFGGGVVSSTTTVEIHNDNLLATNQRYTSGALALDFGLDIRLTNTLDLRALDYGATAGGNAGMAYANLGLVYHFPTRK